MFPIVHYYANLAAYGQVPSLMVLGGLFPDLASGAGMERNDAHQMGAGFHSWCAMEAVQALPLARGVISHGVMPFGVDYYADEYWPGCERGWCFEQGRPWIEKIAAVTRLPERLWWWKSHNFVEMSYELLTTEQYPGIATAIMEAIGDEALLQEAAEILHGYTGRDKGLISGMFRKTPRIFALEEVNARTLAERQSVAFRRHNIQNADIGGMTALLEEMKEALREGYAIYMDEANKLVKKMLANY